MIKGNVVIGSTHSGTSELIVRGNGTDNGILKIRGNISGTSNAKLNVSGFGTLEVGKTLSLLPNNIEINQRSSIRFNGTTPQQLPLLFGTKNFPTVYIANPLGVLLSENLNLDGDLIIESGKLDDNGYAISGLPAKTLEIWDGAKLVLGYSAPTSKLAFPSGFTNPSLASTSTVIYSGSQDQQIANLNYGNLEILGGGVARKNYLLGETSAKNVSISANLQMGNAKLKVSNTLTLAQTGIIENSNALSYVVLEPGGKMIAENLGTTKSGRGGIVTFPIGTATSYSPAYITNSSNTYNFAITLEDGIRHYGSGKLIENGVVKKTWNVECVGQVLGMNPDVELRLQWDAVKDQALDFNNSKCFVTHYTNNAWTTSDNLQNANASSMSATMTGITSFSPFGVASNPTALPVELLYFKAAKKENGALLTWETASEKNCKGYDLLASADGIHFEAVAYLPSHNGMANYAQRYEFLDKTPRTGLVYYRLKQTDLDGTSNYYAANVIDMGRMSEVLTAFPNPFQERFNVKLNVATAQEINLQINDLTGKTVYQSAVKVAAGQNLIPVEVAAGLPKGMYLLTTRTATQQHTTRLIRQ